MADSVHQTLVFEIAGQRYGLRGDTVRELLRAVAITPLPNSAAHVEGVINVRGQIVPVLDLRRWLGLPARAVEPSDHFVVVSANVKVFALRVDRALALTQLEADAGTVDSPGSPGGFVRVARVSDGLVLLPDFGPLFASSGQQAAISI